MTPGEAFYRATNPHSEWKRLNQENRDWYEGAAREFLKLLSSVDLNPTLTGKSFGVHVFDPSDEEPRTMMQVSVDVLPGGEVHLDIRPSLSSGVSARAFLTKVNRHWLAGKLMGTW